MCSFALSQYYSKDLSKANKEQGYGYFTQVFRRIAENILFR